MSRRLIGLTLPGTDGLPFLKIGITILFSHPGGNLLVLFKNVKSLDKIGIHHSQSEANILAGIMSFPWSFPSFRVWISSATSLFETGGHSRVFGEISRARFVDGYPQIQY